MKANLTGKPVRIVLLSLLVLLLGMAVHSETRAENQFRTIINAERAPFFFTVLPPDTTIVPQSESSITTTLRRNHLELRTVAPGGMVPITRDAGVLVGYYGGSASGLRHRPVVQFLITGTNPIYVDRHSIQRVGEVALQLAPWELPALPGPIILDGSEEDWEDFQPLRSFNPTMIPPRLEEMVLGREITPDESRFWRVGGTLIRELYFAEGRNNWYVAFRTDRPILNNTGFHLRPHPELEIAILVDGRTGPVVYRWFDGAVEWAGQYAMNGTFLELAIEKDAVPTAVMNYITRKHPESAQFDIAASHRTPSRAERFTLGSIVLWNPLRNPTHE